MKNGRRLKSIGDLVIDLTPLLDVIFIFLMVVLCSMKNNDNSLAEAQKTYADAMTKKQEAEDLNARVDGAKRIYQQQLDAYSNKYEGINFVTVYADYQPSERRNRTLHLIRNNDEVYTKEFNTGNADSVWKECEGKLIGILSEDKDVPMILSVATRSSRMLYRDEVEILKIYDKLHEDKDSEGHYRYSIFLNKVEEAE